MGRLRCARCGGPQRQRPDIAGSCLACGDPMCSRHTVWSQAGWVCSRCHREGRTVPVTASPAETVILVDPVDVRPDPRVEAWAVAQQMAAEAACATGTVTHAAKGGLLLDVGLAGVRAWMPAMMVDVRTVSNLPRYVGRQLHSQVVELDVRRHGIVLSRRAWLIGQWRRFAADHRRGDTVTGTVTKVADFGVLVQVADGVTGLVHVSRLGVRRPELGAELQVRIVDFDRQRQRISLSPARQRNRCGG